MYWPINQTSSPLTNTSHQNYFHYGVAPSRTHNQFFGRSQSQPNIRPHNNSLSPAAVLLSGNQFNSWVRPNHGPSTYIQHHRAFLPPPNPQPLTTNSPQPHGHTVPRGSFVPVIQNQQSSFARKSVTKKAQKSKHSQPASNNKRGEYKRLSSSQWKELVTDYYVFLISKAGNLGLSKYCKNVLKDCLARKTFQNHWPEQMQEYTKQNIPLKDPRVKAIFEKQFPSQKAVIPLDPNVNSVTIRDESMVRTPPNQNLSAKSDSIFNGGEEKYFQGVLCHSQALPLHSMSTHRGTDCKTCK
jgi:hypothetical protein